MTQHNTPDRLPPDRLPADRLPPEREWPDLTARADRVIAEVGRDLSPDRRRGRSLVATTAAAAAAVVAVLGIGVLGTPNSPNVTAEPTVAPVPTVPPTPPALPLPRLTTIPVVRVGDTVALRHARITVREVVRVDRGVAVRVETCVVDAPPEKFPAGAPVRLDDWTAARNDHSWVVVAWADDSGRVPAYPNAARVAPGDCVSGWIPPVSPPGDGPVSLVYRGELGDQVRWIVG